jgi:hypothetical protein
MLHDCGRDGSICTLGGSKQKNGSDLQFCLHHDLRKDHIMKIEQVPVTGNEEKMQLTPQMRALSEFYQALNERDIERMARNWAQSDEAVMNNPVGGIKRGWEEIRTVYDRIFSSPSQYWFEFYDETCGRWFPPHSLASPRRPIRTLMSLSSPR